MDGDLAAFRRTMLDLDGKVDALGVGGADIAVVIGDRRYVFREIANLVKGVKNTPVVDGSGLKHTLEREAIYRMHREGVIDFDNEHVLLVSAVDRYGMAQALSEVGRHVVYGDLMFGLGLPIRLRSYRSVERLGALALPVVTKLPFQWFYPTGEKQDRRSPRFPWAFQEATVICGDWHFIRRFAPDDLKGKTIVSQTFRADDLKWLKEAGAERAIATTPIWEGETFATNVMEGVLITLLGKHPQDASPEEYLELLERLGWHPTVVALQG